METMTLRVRAASIVLEGLLSLVILGFVALGLWSFEPGPVDQVLARRIYFAVAVVALTLLLFGRWRRRIIIDQAGIQWRRSKNHSGRRIGWEEIDELFILGPEEFELRGAGKSIRFTPSYGGVIDARVLVSRRLESLRERLRSRALRDGELVFRMPVQRWKAHAVYLTVLLAMTGVTAALLLPILGKGRFGVPVILMIFGARFVWKLRRRASGLGTVVTVYRDGLLVKRLDGSDRIAWSTVSQTDWNEQGGLDLVLNTGKRVALPATLANLILLEGFIEEARGAAAGS